MAFLKVVVNFDYKIHIFVWFKKKGKPNIKFGCWIDLLCLWPHVESQIQKIGITYLLLIFPNYSNWIVNLLNVNLLYAVDHWTPTKFYYNKQHE
jgi:hypothetical protein